MKTKIKQDFNITQGEMKRLLVEHIERSYGKQTPVRIRFVTSPIYRDGKVKGRRVRVKAYRYLEAQPVPAQPTADEKKTALLLELRNFGKGGFISAIKHCRAVTGMGLAEAKTFIETEIGRAHFGYEYQ